LKQRKNVMKDTLAPPIAAYIAASNGRSAEALIACFTRDAVVVDEGHTYRGSDEIRQWLARTVEVYAFTLEATHVAEQGGETVVTCRVTGTFPGSPIHLRFFFTLEGDKIAALTIRA
jgi:ketosteroid isomerase-like protein